MAKAKRQAVKQLVVEAEKERDELKAKLFSAEHLADASVVLLEQLECARKVNESISAKWGEAEAKLAEALEDARAARRERDEAVRVREEMDTDAQHRAERYCHEKTLVARERDKALVEIARLRKCIDSIACMLGWMNTPPQDTLEKSISALNARVKELEETVRLRDEKLALEAETIALNHEAERGRCVMALGELPDAVLAGDVYHDAVVRVWEVLNGVSTKIFEEAMDRAQKARSRAWQLFADSRKAERERDELREKLADRDREYSRALGVVGRLQEEGVRARQELDELKVKLAEVGEVLEGVWAKVVFTDTTLRKKVRALLKRGE